MTQDCDPSLRDWAKKWGVPTEALPDLLTLIGGTAPPPPPPPHDGASESWAQSAVRLEAAHFGIRLYRNNVGALKDLRGVPVRFGLANDSPEINKVLKSGDLIGIRPVIITPAHVGRTIGQFYSREIKEPGWRFTGTARETAQANWAALVNNLGGDAKFATGLGSFDPNT